MEPWLKFRCNSCGWETLGTYNFVKNPKWVHTLPDTDCPKCGSHDSVIDVEDDLPPPPEADVPAIVYDIHSGPRYNGWFEPLEPTKSNVEVR